MSSVLKLTVVLVLAGMSGAASVPIASRLSEPVAEALMVIPAAAASTLAQATETSPEPVAATEATPSEDTANQGRGFYKSDDDYPSAHSGPDASLYPAGHSAPEGHTTYAEHDEDGGDHHYERTKPYHHHHSSSGIDNPAYDPALYHSFVPQEHVQQYVTAYSGGHPYDDLHLPTYVVPAGPWAHGPTQPGAISVHDYVLHTTAPTAASTTTTTTTTPTPSTTSLIDKPMSVAGLLASVLPRSVAILLIRSVSFLLSTIGVVLFGGALTSALCALTPLCTLTIRGLPFIGLRQSAASGLQTMLGGTSVEPAQLVAAAVAAATNGSADTTGTRIARAARLVGTAIAKYQEMQTQADADGVSDREAAAVETIAVTKN